MGLNLRLWLLRAAFRLFPAAFRPKDSGFLPVTKVEPLSAAVCQLETAICLYFLGASRCSVHTLAGAAHELLGGLTTQANRLNPGAVRPPRLLQEFDVEQLMGTRNWNDIRNALKHFQGAKPTGKDLDDVKNLAWLSDAVLMAHDLGGRESDVVALLCFWTRVLKTEPSLMYPACYQRHADRENKSFEPLAEAPQTRWAREELKRRPYLKVPPWFERSIRISG